MASATARAYNGGLWVQSAEPPVGVQGAEPPVEVRGLRPLKPTRFLCLKLILFFNASVTVLHEMMYCFSCFFCAQVYEFSHNLQLFTYLLKRQYSWFMRMRACDNGLFTIERCFSLNCLFSDGHCLFLICHSKYIYVSLI